MLPARWIPVVLLVGVMLAGCGSAAVRGDAQGTTAEQTSAIAQIHRSRCGACHMRVEPRTRTRPVLEAALARHADRVHLDKAAWSEMLDYLAPPAVSAVHARGDAGQAHN